MTYKVDEDLDLDENEREHVRSLTFILKEIQHDTHYSLIDY
jgi:hypothetical protein